MITLESSSKKLRDREKKIKWLQIPLSLYSCSIRQHFLPYKLWGWVSVSMKKKGLQVKRNKQENNKEISYVTEGHFSVQVHDTDSKDKVLSVKEFFQPSIGGCACFLTFNRSDYIFIYFDLGGGGYSATSKTKTVASSSLVTNDQPIFDKCSTSSVFTSWILAVGC